MPLERINIIYNPQVKEYCYNGIDNNELPHYRRFFTKLKQNLPSKDITLISSWDEVQDNSLVILYEYQGFYEDLKTYSQRTCNEIFRRIFIISDSFRAFYHPYNYQEKSFAGTLYNIAYDFFAQGGGFNEQYPSFYVDERATNKLRETYKEQNWRVTDTVPGLFGYSVVFNKDNLIKPLAIYFNEYMEKFDQLKDIDKFAVQEEEEKPMKKSWWKRIWSKT